MRGCVLPLTKLGTSGNQIVPADINRVMNELSDRELWAEAARGSDSAFSALFERHATSLYNYCFRRTADWAAAEDLMAATFLEAWRKRDEVEPTGDSIRPWLLGVATNLLRNHWRSRRRREAALERVALERPRDEVDAAAYLEDEADMRALLALVSQMPERDREVVALTLWSGLTYEETATALGVPVGTVRSRLSRAKARLRELASDNGHDQSARSALARAAIIEPGKGEG